MSPLWNVTNGGTVLKEGVKFVLRVDLLPVSVAEHDFCFLAMPVKDNTL